LLWCLLYRMTPTHRESSHNSHSPLSNSTSQHTRNTLKAIIAKRIMECLPSLFMHLWNPKYLSSMSHQNLLKIRFKERLHLWVIVRWVRNYSSNSKPFSNNLNKPKLVPKAHTSHTR
jgi:hypothetical protein